MLISINQFGGIAPIIGARYLRQDQAQTALNSAIGSGSLEPLRGTTDLMAFAKSGTIRSIYRFGQETDSDTQYWFHWTDNDISAVKGFIAGDVSERTFFTGDGAPKATDNALALTGGGSAYPIAAYMLGLPVPDTVLTCVVVGTPESGATTETRTYTFTWVNSWGEESAPYAASPMPASMTADVATGQTVDITLPVPPTGNHNITAKRIYRSVSGTYLFVAEVTAATTAYNDAILATELSTQELPSLTWQPPPADLAGLVGLPGGVLAGFTGNDVYLSDPFHPFAWPVGYMQPVGYKVVGLGVVDTTLVVLTQGRPYFLQGSHPDSMTMVEAGANQSCASKRSIVSMGGMVIYASPDGLVGLAPGGSPILTKDIFDRDQWQAINPSSIHAYEYERQYVGFYDTGTVQGGFIFDPETGAFAFHDIHAAAGYSDLKNDTLYVVVNNRLHKWATGDLKTYTWKSKKFTPPRLGSPSCYQVGAESYPVAFKVYRDGAMHFSKSVTSDSIGRLPPGIGRAWEMEVSGTAEVFKLVIAESPSEIASVQQ